MVTLDDTERRAIEIFRRRYDPPAGGPELVAEVAAIFNITSEQLIRKSQTHIEHDARSICAWILRRRGWTLPQIGHLLGQRHPSTVYHMLSHIDQDRDLAQLSRELEREAAA